jgi:hypothetical protein
MDNLNNEIRLPGIVDWAAEKAGSVAWVWECCEPTRLLSSKSLFPPRY